MATYSAGGGKEFTKASEGTHLSVCTLVADVGLQPGAGQYPDPKVKIFLRFEIPSERLKYEKDGQEVEGPAVIYANYTASMSPKAILRKRIESWFGKKFSSDGDAEKFDVRKVLGHTCMLQVVHTPDGKYANVENIMAPPKGTAKLKPEGKTVYYGPDDDSQYDDLPKFLQKKVDEQLDPPSRTTTGSTSKTSATPSSSADDAFADAEAELQAQRRSAKGAPLDDFEDADVPF